MLYDRNQCISYKCFKSKSIISPYIVKVSVHTNPFVSIHEYNIPAYKAFKWMCDTDMAMHTHSHANTHTHTYSTDSKTERNRKRRGLTSINVLQMGVNPLLPHCDYCFLQGLVLTPSLAFPFPIPPPPLSLPNNFPECRSGVV